MASRKPKETKRNQLVLIGNQMVPIANQMEPKKTKWLQSKRRIERIRIRVRVRERLRIRNKNRGSNRHKEKIYISSACARSFAEVQL